MLWSMMRLIFKTSSVTPDFFYVFNIILSFSNCSQSFKKICTWELLGANVLKQEFNSTLQGSEPKNVMMCNVRICTSWERYKFQATSIKQDLGTS